MAAWRRTKAWPITPFDRERLISARVRAGLSVEQLAKKVRVNRVTMYRIEKGGLLSTPKLPELYEALRLPVELIGRPDPDEAALLESFRRLRDALPEKAPEFVASARRWADEAEAIRQERDALAERERRLRPE